MRRHWLDNGEPLCRRVPNFSRMTNHPAMVTCKRCVKLLAELAAKAEASK